MKYQEKLKDPRWQRKRLEVLQYAGFRCQICGDKTSTLHVHHSRYVKGKAPWQYPLNQLLCVCVTHHEMIRGKKELEPYKALTLENQPLPKSEVSEQFAKLRKQLSEK